MSENRGLTDGPLGGLTPAERVLLRKPQLELAVAEVRFVDAGAEIESEHVLKIREVLAGYGFNLPQVQPAQTQDLTLKVSHGEVEPEVNVRSTGWMLTSSDTRLVVTVLPGVLAIQSTQYERWKTSLEAPLVAALEGVAETLAPTLVQRVGLRYVNRLNDSNASSVAAWSDAIAPHFFGVLGHGEIGPKAIGCQQQITLQLGDAQGAVIRHGVFKDAAANGMYSYLVDIDVFDQTADAFVADDISASARALNRTALSLFQQVVTSEHRNTMEPYAEVDEEGNIVVLNPRDSTGEGGKL